MLKLTRDEVLARFNEIIVAPATRTVRGLATEVILTEDDGMLVTCALNFDHVALAQRARIGAIIAVLAGDRWPDVRAALLTACGLAEA